MPNTFSMPNYHEDQPTAIETQLIGQLAGANPGGNKSLAGVLLQAEQNRRSATQQDYHNYLSGVNQLQAGSIAANSQDHSKTEFTKLLGLNLPGATDAYNAQFPGSMPDPATMAPLNEAIKRAADSKNMHEFGLGYGGIRAGGGQVDQSAMPPGMTTGGNQAVVDAQAMANKGRIGAALIGATHLPPDKVEQTDGTLENPRKTTTYSRPTGAPAGFASAIKQAPGRGGPALGPNGGDAGSRALMADPSLAQPNDVSTAAPTTQAPAQPAVTPEMALSKLQRADSAKYADVIKGAAANGGKLQTGISIRGLPGLKGATGQVYD